LARRPIGGDEDQIRAVIGGVCDLGVVNSYYAANFIFIDQNLKQQSPIRILLPNAADRGTHVSISSAALMKHAQNKEDGVKLIEFLTSAQGQRIYSAINNEYPVSEAVPPPSLMASWEPLKPDSLPLHTIAALRYDALTLIERTGFDQVPDYSNTNGIAA